MATARSWTVWAITLLLLASCSSSPDDEGKPYIARVLEARREAGRARQRADRLEVARYRDAHQEYREAKNSEAVAEEFQTAGQFAKSLSAFERALALYRGAEALALKSARADITALRQVIEDLDRRAEKHRASELLPAAYATTRELLASADAAAENGDLGASLRTYEKAKIQLEALEQQTVTKLREMAVQRRELVVALQQNVRELHGDVHAPEPYRIGSESLAEAQEHLAAERYFEAQKELDEAREALNEALGTAREVLAGEMKIAEQRRERSLKSHQKADAAHAAQVARPAFEQALSLLEAGDQLFAQRRFEDAGLQFDRAGELFEESLATAIDLRQAAQQAAMRTATARSEADKIRASELSQEAYEQGEDLESRAATHLEQHQLAEARQLYGQAATAFEQATSRALESMRRSASNEKSQRLKISADEVLSRVEAARRSAEKFQPREGQGATFGQGEVAFQEGQQFYLDEDYTKAKERFEAAIGLFAAAADEARETVRRELGRLRAECDSLKTELQGRGVVLGDDYVAAVEALTTAQTHDELNELVDARRMYQKAKRLFGRAASELVTAPPIEAASAGSDRPDERPLASGAPSSSRPASPPAAASGPASGSENRDSGRGQKLILGAAIVGLLIGAAVLLLLARPKRRTAQSTVPIVQTSSGRRTPSVSGRSPAVGPRSSVNHRPGLNRNRPDQSFPSLSNSRRGGSVRP